MRLIQKLFRGVSALSFLVRPQVSRHIIFRSGMSSFNPDFHLNLALNWLSTAHKQSSNDGVCAWFSLLGGWSGAYPETTGYLIPTLLHYSDYFDKADYRACAQRMADWELGIQLPSGGVRGGVGLNDYPVVFNTGQVMFGWNAIYERTHQDNCLEASIRAGKWLRDVQDEDGAWRAHTFQNRVHSYNVRTAWALLETAQLSQRQDLHEAGERAITWALKHAQPNGFLKHMEFYEGQTAPFTHTLAYTYRGLLEAATFLPDLQEELTSRVMQAMLQLYKANRTRIKQTGFLSGQIHPDWTGNSRYVCLTGSAQIAIIFFKLAELTGNEVLREAAENLVRFVASTQITDGPPSVRGGIAGSWPIYGAYLPYAYPNWAAKFFVDALMLYLRFPQQNEESRKRAEMTKR